MATQKVKTGALELIRIRRGVKDVRRSAEFFAWLLGLEPERTSNGFRFQCDNGEFTLDEDTSAPVSLDFSSGEASFRGHDLDGVPLTVSDQGVQPATGSVMLDHVSLMCADLAATIRFYMQFGFVVTWSGAGDRFVEGLQEEPIAGVDWVHLSGSDGYLALSQADWLEYGRQNAASGPPRFVHIGLAMADLTDVASRLDQAKVAYLRASPNPLGERLYLNDPDGTPELGTNVELVKYEPGVFRSGLLQNSLVTH